MKPVRDGLVVERDGHAVLIASQCATCGHVDFPAQGRCARCSRGGTWEIYLGPRGTMVGWTSVLNRAPGVRIPVPYRVGLVEFGEGVRIIGLVSDEARDDLAVGQSVQVVTEPAYVDDDGTTVTTYKFRS